MSLSLDTVAFNEHLKTMFSEAAIGDVCKNRCS